MNRRPAPMILAREEKPHTETQTDRQTNRQTDRQTVTQLVYNKPYRTLCVVAPRYD